MEMPEGWEEVEGALERTFRFNDFAHAIDFVNRVAQVAEDEEHHPDIAIHWNKVTLRWWTHAGDAITDRDYELAKRTNELA
jgi:4a-hydroxytetrahydrobiopterin dehydratase